MWYFSSTLKRPFIIQYYCMKHNPIHVHVYRMPLGSMLLLCTVLSTFQFDWWLALWLLTYIYHTNPEAKSKRWKEHLHGKVLSLTNDYFQNRVVAIVTKKTKPCEQCHKYFFGIAKLSSRSYCSLWDRCLWREKQTPGTLSLHLNNISLVTHQKTTREEHPCWSCARMFSHVLSCSLMFSHVLSCQHTDWRMRQTPRAA